MSSDHAGPGVRPPSAGGGAAEPAGVAAAELADARYYLEQGCVPCARRHVQRARRLGATEEQIRAAVPALVAHRRRRPPTA